VASMISTSDNPFNPFDDYDAWFNWDMVKGYHTPSLLDRLMVTSDQLSDSDQAADLEDAIDRLVDLNPNGMIIKVTRDLTKV
jgi:hypothetical protein